MRRRGFIALLSGAATIWSPAARAQQKAVPVIGFLSTLETIPEFVDAFRKGLAERGYNEDQNSPQTRHLLGVSLKRSVGCRADFNVLPACANRLPSPTPG